MLSETKKSKGEFETDLLNRIVRLALDEDKVEEDITTDSLIEYDRQVRAEIIAKQNGLISGFDALKKTFTMVDPKINIQVIKGDGAEVNKGDVIALIEGRESSILKAERTALNFIQRLSGIATTTREFVERLRTSTTTLLDTRKTTPGMRYLEKKAVRDGGGTNHRLNLEDMVMIKDNHIRMVGSISKAITEVRKINQKKKIEVEVSNLTELKEALDFKVDFIMLDNFTVEEVKEAVRLNQHKVKLEVSGNITLNNIEAKIIPGIDFISVGALTHSFQSMDLSLEIVSELKPETE
ncbi:MAG: carboxylating nicotinate-nucleotide diphosphorylase [Candidatus Aminicenantes bacterium]|nr:carboxylating nicotinate-nucleotide diphosphorylase [Candidatus Aminicenantes bacterium]